MSDAAPDLNQADFIKRYTQGEERYVRFAEEILGATLAETQKEILTAVENNQHVLIISGNGVGKSYSVSMLNLAFLYCNLEATVLATSGSYSQLRDTMYKPMSKMLRRAQEQYSFLPGRTVENPPQIKFDNREDQYLKCISTRNPGALEGRHSAHILAVVEEADKPEVTEDVIDSARSSITDEHDRMVVIANPPKSEANSVVKLMESDNWHTIQFSSFESRNVKVDAGESNKEKIPGLVDLSKVRDDWEEWNDKPWPGYEDAKNSAELWDDLDTRWYRRRLGVIPPDDATAIRPFMPSHVAEANERFDALQEREDNYPYDATYKAYGVDVARGGGDRTVIAGVTDYNTIDILASVEKPGHHDVNKELIREHVHTDDVPVIIDAIGEGSGVADDLDDEFSVTRFKSGENAIQDEKYYDKRTEALGELGKWLKGDGKVEPETDLTHELRAASRTVEFEEKTNRRGDTFKATSKEELKKSTKLGRSPDFLDAASLAVWGMNLCSAGEPVGMSFLGDTFEAEQEPDEHVERIGGR